MLKTDPGIVRGRIVGSDSNAAWKVAVMEFHAEDPELRTIVAQRPDEKGGFEIKLPPLPYETPFAVVGFEDSNGNDRIDKGEDFVGSRSVGAGYSGKGMFLFTQAGTFVGDRSWDLSEITFVIDVK